jgi:hypothetical protein
MLFFFELRQCSAQPTHFPFSLARTTFEVGQVARDEHLCLTLLPQHVTHDTHSHSLPQPWLQTEAPPTLELL